MQLKRFAMAAAGVAFLAILATASLLPASGGWTVKDSAGNTIGSGSTSASGNVFVFRDNPNQNHPPNTSGSWAVNSAGTGYSNGGGHTVTFEHYGGGVWGWTKTDDSTGNPVDSGTMTGSSPGGPPTPFP